MGTRVLCADGKRKHCSNGKFRKDCAPTPSSCGDGTYDTSITYHVTVPALTAVGNGGHGYGTYIIPSQVVLMTYNPTDGMWEGTIHYNYNTADVTDTMVMEYIYESGVQCAWIISTNIFYTAPAPPFFVGAYLHLTNVGAGTYTPTWDGSVDVGVAGFSAVTP